MSMSISQHSAPLRSVRSVRTVRAAPPSRWARLGQPRLQSPLLTSPPLPWVADDPQDAVVAKQYKSNKAEFEATAKYWTDIYAGELSPKP